MKYKDLRDFIEKLEAAGQLKRIKQPISTDLTMTEIQRPHVKGKRPCVVV